MSFETLGENSPKQKKGKYDYLKNLRGERYEETLRQLLLSDSRFLPTFEQLQSAYRDTEEIWEDDVRSQAHYELTNKDYISKFAEHLSERIKKGKGKKVPLRILEIGAGDGRFSHFLRQSLVGASYKEGVDFTLSVTDSFGWGIKPSFPVLKMKDKDAVRKFKPQVVFASWLPGDSFDRAAQKPNPEDSLDFVRNQGSVEEYILIGDPKATVAEAELKNHLGFEVSELKALSVLQVCRNDDPMDIGKGVSKSKTFSFVRTREDKNH